MNWAVLVIFLGVLLGFCASQETNQECTDLDKISKNIKGNSALLKLAKITINCARNKNCSGMDCSGSHNKKTFNASIILQGCKEPITLQVYHKNKQIYTLKDGSKTHLFSRFYAFTSLRKTGNVVTVSVEVKTCLTDNAKKSECIWPSANVIKNEQITVNCGKTHPTIPVVTLPRLQSTKPSYTDPTIPVVTLPRLQPQGTKPSYTGVNPECQGWKSAQSMIKRNFNIMSSLLKYRAASINCQPSKDCSELRCTGSANKDSFTTLLFLDYCSHPITLRVDVSVPNKKINIHHTFQDGQNYTIYGIPMTVDLKRKHDTIYLSIYESTTKLSIIKNLAIKVDPKHCPKYHPFHGLTPSHQGTQHCDSMFSIGKVIEKHGDIKCSSIDDCKELRCSGMIQNKNFTAVCTMSYCTKPVTMNMTIYTGGRTFHHSFRDGDVDQMPKLPIKVGLKPMKKEILVNIFVNKEQIVKDEHFIMDPSRCQTTGQHSKSLSKGAIAGIVIGVLIFIAVLILLVVFLFKKKGLSTRVARYNDLAMSDDSDPLVYDFEPSLA